MIINHNIAALNTYRQLSSNNSAQSKSLEKLSSGYRINRAGDDAAGLAISEKMRGQIRGLDQATRNAQDGISLIQTAEGALNETHSILQRMRELAVQAANDTNTDADRTSIQEEITQLKDEIDRIGNTTEFNTKKLLNGGAAVAATVTGTNADDVTVLGGSSDTTVGASFSITATTVATADNSTTTATFSGTSDTMTATSTITLNGVSFSFSTSNTVQDVLDTINGAGIGVTATFDTTTSKIDLTASTVGSKSEMTVTGTPTGSLAGTGTITQGADATVTFTATTTYTADGNTITVQAGTAKGLQFSVDGVVTGTTTFTVDSNGGVNLQIGANENQNMYVSIGDMRAAALGVNSLDLSTASLASSAITTIDTATASVSTQRSKLGAYQNRLEHTINNLGTSSENLSAAESRVRDVDMAKEMMAYTKQSILSQAATAMLAQANQIPQGVLQLLQ